MINKIIIAISLGLTFFYSEELCSQQETMESEKHYYTIVSDLVIQKWDLIKNLQIDDQARIAQSGTKFYLVKTVEIENNLFYIIKLWPFKKTEDNLSVNNKNDKYVGYKDNPNYFSIKASDFVDSKIRKTYYTGHRNVSFTTGILVVPLKIRPRLDENRPFTYTTDVTLGTSFGFKTRINKFKHQYLNLAGYFGLTSVSIDSVTTDGFVNQSLTQPAITLAVGTIFEVDGFQVGFVMGSDMISGEIGDNWVYNFKPWWSIGLGYQFLSGKKND